MSRKCSEVIGSCGAQWSGIADAWLRKCGVKRENHRAGDVAQLLECLSSIQEAVASVSRNFRNWGVVVHICNSSIRERESAGSGVPGLLPLRIEFKVKLGYMRLWDGAEKKDRNRGW